MSLTWRILTGDVRETLKSLPDQSVQTVVTSPPYFRQRDYERDDQIGWEESGTAYVSELVKVFRSVRRVLVSDGSLWLNVGDGYDERLGVLLGTPWAVAFALRDDGWWLQSDVIWSKPIGAPSGGSTRPLRTHEYVFLFSSSRYFFYDADAIREPLSAATLERYRYSVKPIRSKGDESGQRKMLTPNPAGRFSRSVWHLSPETSNEYHDASFPEDLPERCILAGSRPGDTVMDPFTGSGTTGAVAIRHGRNFIGCELNPAYVELAEKRIGSVSPLFAEQRDDEVTTVASQHDLYDQSDDASSSGNSA